jgi:regulatory protein
VSARSLALRLLGRRDYTAAELRQKLVDRETAPDDAEAVVAQLQAEGLVDDRRAAASHVRTAANLKLRGRGRIARELAARGVDAEVAAEALASVTADADAESIARILSRKRVPARLDPAERRRIFQHLLRRGFSADAISKALRARGREEDTEP